MITVYGDIILDVYMNVEYLKPSPESQGGVYQLVNGSKFSDMRLGGAAAVAAIATKLGAKCWLLAPLVKDKFGNKVCELLDKEKVEHVLDYIDSSTSLITTVKFRHVCNGALLPDRFDRQVYYPYTTSFVPTRTLVISDYGRGACHDIVDTIEAYRHTSNIIVDPSPDCNWLERYKGAHVIKCNRAEALKQVAMQKLPNKYIENVIAELANKLDCILVVTNAEMAIEIYGKTCDKNRTCRIAIPVVKPVDPTGAGDTITAAIAVILDQISQLYKCNHSLFSSLNIDDKPSFENVCQACSRATVLAAKQVQSLGVAYDLGVIH